MSDIAFTIDDRAVNEALSRLQRNAADLTGALQQAGDQIAEDVRDTFGQSADPWGNAWEELSYQTKIKRLGGVGKILVG